MRKLLYIALVASFGLLTACNRDEANPEGTAIVYVKDTNGTPIQNARVLFKSPVDVPNGLEVYKYTDEDGSAFFKWDFHIYADVEARKFTQTGCASIPVIPGETTEREVIIYPYGTQANGCP